MVAVPGPTEVAKPLLLIVATVGAEEVQVAWLVMLLVEPSAKFPVAVNCTALPLNIVAFCGVKVMEFKVGAAVVRLVLALNPFTVVVMVVVP